MLLNGNALRTTCHYQQEVLDESIGACTNSLPVCIYAHNSEGIATVTKLYYLTSYA